MTTCINPSTFSFLKELSTNNNRDWFNKHKSRYLKAHENIIEFTDAILLEMRKHDHIENELGKDSLMRIYRDTRFSQDKTPYKTYFAGSFNRATKRLRGGYYFKFGPGQTLAAGGFFSPDPKDLLRIRKDIDANYKDWKKMIDSKSMVKTFNSMIGETVATSPKRFSKDNPAIELLKHKEFYFERTFTDAEVLNKAFLKELNTTFKTLRPYFNYMSEMLTTDANGRSIV